VGLSLTWTEEASAFVNNFAAAYATRNEGRRQLLKLQGEGVANEILRDYELTHNLDRHQRVAVAAMTDPVINGLCLFDEQGVGKTVMTIHAFDRLVRLGQCDVMVVFAPKNMLLIWKQDFKRFLGDKYRIQIITGERRKKYEALLKPADVYVTNYETAHQMEASLRSLLTRHARRLVMTVDESFFIKNSQAERAAAIRRLRNYASRCWVLCGTPAPNHALDVVHQFDVADCGVTFGGASLPTDPEDLWQAIKNIVEKRGLYLRRLKRDVFPDLPKKNFEAVAVPMEQTQRELYAHVLFGLVHEIESTDADTFRKTLPAFLAQRMSLFQICSHPRQVFPDYANVPGKHVALDRLLEQLIDTRGEKVVLWSFFRYSLDQLEVRYRHYHPVRVDGSISSAAARADAVARFQNDTTSMLFIGNPAAAGAGITLTTSRIAIYESFPVQTAHYLQSIDRIHRRGQNRDTHYYFLLSQQTLEESEYQRLLEKERRAFELFGDPKPDTITKELLLRELKDELLRLI
jgi:SNF2 family DNA or RNA helicase